MKFYVTSILIFFSALTNYAQIIDIPDANFKYLLVYGNHVMTVNSGNNQVSADTNGDYEIQQSEAEAVVWMRMESFGNEISSLEGIEYFTNLELLYLEDNYLTSLDVSMLSQLRVLDCSNNNLDYLNVAGLSNLSLLNIEDTDSQRDNEVSNLDLSGLSSLTALHCARNGISELDFSDTTSLELLSCEFNEIIELDLSEQTNLNNLRANSNALTTLNIKNGSIGTQIRFNNNPDLAYLCVDNNEMEFFETYVDTWGLDNCVVNSYCSFNPGGEFYNITGQVTYDQNNDGCDSQDVPYPFLNLTLENSNQELVSVIYADNSGNYSFSSTDGTYTVVPSFENPSYFNINPSNPSVTFPSDPNPSVIDFCVTPDGQINDLEIFIVPLNDAVPGFDSDYKIIYRNKGNTTRSGEIEFRYFGDYVSVVSANPVIDIQESYELFWNFTDLEPFETREIELKLNLNTPTDIDFPLNYGDVLVYSAFARPLSDDETFEDNHIEIPHFVTNSFDPNDMTCLQGDTVNDENIGEYVHYLIRFENLGTANATNVVVKDVIDSSKFNISSLQPLSGSHNFLTQVRSGNVVEFIFENIQLPFDDNNNDGYVLFKIKLLDSLQIGDSFNNKAEIYFDFNFPIITNTYETTIENNLSINDFEDRFSVELFPNPADEKITITSSAFFNAIDIFDVNGKLVTSILYNDLKESAEIDISTFSKGFYIFKIKNNKGIISKKFVKR